MNRNYDFCHLFNNKLFSLLNEVKNVIQFKQFST